ncbi:MAG: GTP-binding protein [Promethearchaeota archaeon]|nr:MAG: GTP-binding protein [Candidatus Lokiarchaeota archaeon]
MSLYVFKVILIGPGAVGKTSLLHRFVENKFSFRYKLTIGADFLSKIINYKDSTIKMQIWDIGGQERYKFLRSSFFDGANGALMVFDLSRWHTFEELDEWLSDLREYAGEKIPFALIGNKIDLIDKKEEIYERESAQVFAKKENTFYIETSAKTGENVEGAFLDLTNKMIKNVQIK